ncbi:class I SAM-dependent methyltransferase [Seleniivibrio woodruffii]|uniref:Methyltransferase family protein n=1 Tax=Seleniivibrio woodruffii TaxID=1078050 RepID=A0A4R1K973_9BACT|nr:class I SAM-dependent methyltransferase [Seleniivibrio woodruffii]TCK60567.1 methyltransferase family protein [Seleniivibrio woodruffii]TVZ36195.1 methyltransferase family protein [Seleniivibrio woodruffii]
MAKGTGRDHEFMLERWKKKAAGYPRYKNSEDVIEAQIYRSINSAGVDFRGRSVLDVGCGTGVYTIRIAKDAAKVTGIDISKEMLDILQEDAADNGCENIETIISPWDTFPLDGRRWDITVSTMTPAVQTFEDYEKVYESASEAVVYLGWGGKRDVEPVKYIAQKSQIKPVLFNNSLNMKKWLDGKGFRYYSEIYDEERYKHMSFEEAVSYCFEELETNEVFALRGDIERELQRFVQEDRSVKFKIDVRLELIVYKK